jgi:hypothetical protein
MSAPLAARAAEMATNGRPAAATPATRDESPGLPDVELGESPDDWDQVPVHIAWLRVRREVRFIGKLGKYVEEYGQRAGQVKYNFRGVDHAVNVFGPATLKHGVSVLPIRVEATYRDTKSSNNKSMRECTAKVTYLVIGPKGDHIEVQSVGESLDVGDKGTSKAMSVALRILLLHGGLVPTGDPDPDAGNVERGEAQIRSAASYRDEVLHPGTTRERMHQIRRELIQHRMIGASVENEAGQAEPIGNLIDRVGRERFARPAPQPPPADAPDVDPETGEPVPPGVGVRPDKLTGASPGEGA